MVTLKEIEEIKNKYKPLIKNAWEAYRDICDNEKKEFSALFNLEGKFICIDEEDYIYVQEQFEHRSIINNEPIIVLRGQGFKYLISSYADSTYASWDQFFSYEFEIKNIETELPKIKEITKEEYNNAFDKMIEQVKNEHYSYLNS